MLGNIILHIEMTKIKFGYHPNTLNIQSSKLIVAECQNCHSIIDRPFKEINRKHRCPIVVGNTKRCFKCKSWKDLSLFNKCPKLSGGVAKLCKKCYNKHEAVINCEKNRRYRIKHCFYKNFDLFISRKLYAIKSRAKKQNLAFNIDKKFLLNLWNNQNGLCYYSGLAMKTEGKINKFQGWFAPSIDRKDPNKGYIKENIVWCCFAINSFKQSMTEIDFLNILKEIKWKINC